VSDDLIREVDEEVKRDQWLALWNQYGWYAVGLIVFVLAATGGTTLWQNYRAEQQIVASERFLTAASLASEDNIDDALAALDEIVREESDGYSMVAQFRQAALLSESDDAEPAIEIYALIADDEAYEDLYRDLAVILMAVNSVSGENAVGDTDAMRGRLSAIAVDSNPFRHSARELSAALALVRGDREDAANHLKALADSQDTPISTRQRATELLQAIQ
jgi:hypothetical protein